MSLKEKLDETRKGAVERIPAETLALMHQATNDLRESGIMEGVLKVGDQAPEFNLPNPDGQTVSMSEALKNGPVVVSFYRGIW